MSRNGFKADHPLFISCLFLCWIIAFGLGRPNAALPMEVVRLSPVETFIKDRLSIQLVSGSLFSTEFPNGHAHTLDYWQTNLLFGWAMNQPGPEPSFFRGNFEALLEITGSVVYRGSGNYLAGGTALLRYNFVPLSARLNPYLQAGAGIVYNDIYRDKSQDAIGQAIEFTPQASLGLRYLIHPNWSLDAEACSTTSPTPTSLAETTGSTRSAGSSGPPISSNPGGNVQWQGDFVPRIQSGKTAAKKEIKITATPPAMNHSLIVGATLCGCPSCGRPTRHGGPLTFVLGGNIGY